MRVICISSMSLVNVLIRWWKSLSNSMYIIPYSIDSFLFVHVKNVKNCSTTSLPIVKHAKVTNVSILFLTFYRTPSLSNMSSILIPQWIMESSETLSLTWACWWTRGSSDLIIWRYVRLKMQSITSFGSYCVTYFFIVSDFFPSIISVMNIKMNLEHCIIKTAYDMQ